MTPAPSPFQPNETLLAAPSPAEAAAACLPTPSAVPTSDNPQTNARLVQIWFDKGFTSQRSAVMLGLSIGLFMACLVILLVAFPGMAAALGRSAIFVFAAMAAAFVFLFRWYRSGPGDIAALLGPQAPTIAFDERIRAVLPKLRSLNAGNSLKELARTLAAEQHTGAAIRIVSAKTPPIGPPIEVQFEPRPLDACGQPEAISSDGTAGEAADLTLQRRVRRNILLKGGWIMLAMFGFNFSIALLKSWHEHRINPGVYSWGIALAAILFMPVRGGGWKNTQWLVVPGGVVFRSAPFWSQSWTTRLYDQSRSVIIAFNHRRSLWGLAVSDGQTAECAVGTREEMDYALRAFLSPLPPPKVEWLSNPN